MNNNEYRAALQCLNIEELFAKARHADSMIVVWGNVASAQAYWCEVSKLAREEISRR